MKKLLIGFLALSLVMLGFVSCNSNAITEADAVGNVSFAEELYSSATKGLTASVEQLNKGNLFWRYTAVKKDGAGTTGGTGDHDVSHSLPVNGTSKGLNSADNPIVFSAGEWEFKLYAFDGDSYGVTDAGKYVYYAATAKAATVSAGKSNTVTVGVTATSTSGNGYIRLENITTPYASSKVDVKCKVDNDIEWTSLTPSASSWSYNFHTLATPRDFSCTDSHTIEVGVFNKSGYGQTSTAVVSSTIKVSVFRGLYTVISGSVDDLTGGVIFDADMPKTVVASESNKATLGSGSTYQYPLTSVEAKKAAPAGDNSTTTKVAAGTTFNSATQTYQAEDVVSTTVTVVSYNEGAAASKFTASSGNAVVAGVDLTMNVIVTRQNEVVSETTATQFSAPVIVTTYISGNYDDVTLKYNNGTSIETWNTRKTLATDVAVKGDYYYEGKSGGSAGSGKFVFATDHFSAYYFETPAVAKIIETGKAYQTLAAAVTGATNGQTIELNSVVSTDAQIEIADKSVIIDLNGYAISYNGPELGSGVLLVHNGAELTINDKSGTAGSISGGTNAYAAIALTKSGDDSNKVAKLVVNGGSLSGNYYAIVGNGSRNNTNITVNGGNLTGTNGTAIYHPQVGTLTVNGGTLTGLETAIELRAGILEINGGTFAATNTEFECKPNGSGTTTKGSAIAIAQHNTEKDISVTINGGTFTGVKSLSECNPQANPAPQVTISVTGGTFNGKLCVADVSGFITGGVYDSDPAKADKNKVSSGSVVIDGTVNCVKAGYKSVLSDSKYIITEGDSWDAYKAAEYSTPITTNGYGASVVTISNEAELALFASDPINGENAENKHTVVNLTADLNLGDHMWTPIRMSCVDFNGNDHTIKNVNVLYSDGKYVGLFGEASISKVENLTVDGGVLEGKGYVAGIAGHGLCGHFINCHAKNLTITTKVVNNDDGDKAGGICGYLSGESTAEVKNCTVSNCTITGYRDCGGAVGIANKTATVEGNTVTNCALICNKTPNPEGYTSETQFDVNNVVGHIAATATVKDNTATNVTITYQN